MLHPQAALGGLSRAGVSDYLDAIESHFDSQPSPDTDSPDSASVNSAMAKTSDLTCQSKQRRTGGPTQQCRTDGGDCVRTLRPGPGHAKGDHRQSPGANCDSGLKAVSQVVESDIVPRQRNLALIGGKSETHRPPDGVLKGFAKNDRIRRTESIVVVACQPCAAVKVCAAQCGLEVEGNYAPRRSDGLSNEQPYFN